LEEIFIYLWIKNQGMGIMKVKLEKYNPKWESLIEIEKEKLLNVLSSNEIKIEHIGSTSIKISVQNR
jgi:GrpB-like predicted nucleotidyltransferase (UPF0157 family)